LPGCCVGLGLSPGCCVGLEETRDGVTGCPTGWFCPYGTTIGLGRWVDGVGGWIWPRCCVGLGLSPGCCVGLGLSPGCYPGLVHRCPSGTGVLGVGDWCGRGLGACGRGGLKRDHLGGLAFEEQAGAGGSHGGWVSDGVAGFWGCCSVLKSPGMLSRSRGQSPSGTGFRGLMGIGNGVRGSEPRAAVR